MTVFIKQHPSIREVLDTAFFSDDLFGFRPVNQERSTEIPINISQSDDAIQLTASLPGYLKDEINVSYDKGVLDISAEKKVIEDDDKHTALVTEISTQTHHRRVKVGSLNVDKAEARYQAGLLTLNIPKAESEKARQIKIKT